MKLKIRTSSGAVLEFTKADKILAGYTRFLKTGQPTGGAGSHIVFNYSYVEFIEVLEDDGMPMGIDFNEWQPPGINEKAGR